MPTRKDWKALAKETIASLDSREVAGLYRVDTRRAVRLFLAEHREEIDAEPRKIRRALKKANALVYGMVRRLTPARRVAFVVAILFLLFGLFDFRAGTSEAGHTPLFSFLGVLLLLGLLAFELVDKLRFRDEILMAKDLQADLVPATLPETPRWELAGFNRVANTVGGDLYDFVPLPDGRLAVLFGDASGHGMAAGLLMAVAQAVFRVQLENDPSPAAVAAALNRMLCRTGACRVSGPRAFFAGIVMLLSEDGAWTAVVAGHPQALRLSAEGRVAERIGTGAYPFGVRDKATWPALNGVLGPGETLLFHSDGLVEARNAAGEEFGDVRIEVVAGRTAATSPALLVAALSDELRRFLGTADPEDDISIAAIRRRMPAS